MKKYKKYAKICAIIFPILFIYIITIFIIHSNTKTYNNNHSIKSGYEPWLIDAKYLAVDSKENIYISCSNNIIVFDNDGHFLHSYNKYEITSFMIDQNDYLIIDYNYVYDLDGILIEKDLNSHSSSSRIVETEDGTKYQLKSFLGYVKVVKEQNDIKKVIYRIPIHLYILKIAFIIAFLSFGYLIFYANLYTMSYMKDEKRYIYYKKFFRGEK